MLNYYDHMNRHEDETTYLKLFVAFESVNQLSKEANDSERKNNML